MTLDVTIQAQVLELLRRLTRESGTAVILITHDLGVVAAMAQRVNVMYAGRIVEAGSAGDIFAAPRHPYTVGLLRSVARPDRDEEAPVAAIPGQPPDPTALPPGCAFAPRCAWRLDRCSIDVPPLDPDGDAPGRAFACHNPATGPEVAAGRPLRAAAFDVTMRVAPVVCAERIREVLHRAAPGAPDLASGAGHDAQVIARAGVPTGMLFVRSLNGGISHSPEEAVAAEDVTACVDALAAALAELSG